MIDSGQIRAARGFLHWSQGELAARAGLSVQTIKRIELAGTGSAALDTVKAIVAALEAGGCTFLDDDAEHGSGVRAKTQG